MSAVSIRTIRSEDYPSIVELWNETHPRDPVTSRIFKRKILLDVNFDPEGFFLTEEEGKRTGFLYAVRRLRALDN